MSSRSCAGRGWTHVVDTGDGRAGEPSPSRQWFLTGTPLLMIMVGVAADDPRLVVARRIGVWRDWQLTYEPGPQPVVQALDDLPEILVSTARARRRSFSWCRYCRFLVATEERTERNVCVACATAVEGVDFPRRWSLRRSIRVQNLRV